jgi:hypothetical protein
MGDFSNGVDQENNMLGEMNQHNDAIKDARKKHNEFLTEQIQSAKGEKGAQFAPAKIAQVTDIAASAGIRAKGAVTTFKDVYDSDVGAYAKNLGRAGGETTFGVRPAIQSAVKGGKAAQAALKSASFKPGAIPDVEGEVSQMKAYGERGQLDAPKPQVSGDLKELGDAGLTDDTVGTAHPDFYATPTEPTPVTATRPSGSAPDAPAGEGAAAGGAEDEAGTIGSKIASKLPATAGELASAAGEVAAKAGVGLGMISAGESIAADFASGKGFHIAGDNKMERWGNGLSIAAGAADTLGLAAPPLAVVGGVLGLLSAGADIIGHLEDASEKAGTAKKEKDKPPETPDQISSIASMGMIASKGTDTLHSITSSSSF